MHDDLKQLIEGDVVDDSNALETYSHDTSLFEIKPKLIVKPKNIDDVKNLVKYVSKQKLRDKSISITARSAGTDMSGGAINDSIILVFEKYINRIGEVKGSSIEVQPGAYYRDFEKVTLAKGKIMPSYPASRDLCAVGGMVANNAGGEKSLIYGKVERFINSLSVVLADGNEYVVKPLNMAELNRKMAQGDYEGNLYKQIYELIDQNYKTIKDAKPQVTKNSTGYKLWDILNKEDETFDLTQLFIGSQGTLGLITNINYKLVTQPKHSGVLAGYARSLDHMGQIIQILKKHNPTTIEAFDEHTLYFAFRFFLQFREGIGWWGLFKLAFSLIPDAFILLRGKPKMIFMASFDDDDYDTIKQKLDSLKKEVDAKHWRITTEEAETEEKAERFWMMRRKSFKLLRENVKGNVHTAPFIDDIVVPSENVQKFWPEIQAIMKKYDLLYTIAGHLGDGNFHIIPLMDLSKKTEKEKLKPCMDEVISLVKKYNGVISGEHNDGLVRGPFLEDIYGKEVFELFKKTKQIFDPQNIFNPHKKTDASWKYSESHIRNHF